MSYRFAVTIPATGLVEIAQKAGEHGLTVLIGPGDPDDDEGTALSSASLTSARKRRSWKTLPRRRGRSTVIENGFPKVRAGGSFGQSPAFGGALVRK